MAGMRVKKGDTVLVLSGKDRGKRGEVLGTIPKKSRVVVQGLNMATCHIKPRRQDEQGGITEREAPLDVCKVQVVCPKCDKPTRVAFKFLDDGKKVRVCKHCGATL